MEGYLLINHWKWGGIGSRPPQGRKGIEMFISEQKVIYFNFTNEEVSAFEKVIETLEKVSTNIENETLEIDDDTHERLYQEDIEKVIDTLYLINKDGRWFVE